jgi:hypothetical protein
LYNALRDTTLNTTFPGNSIGEQFETVATMMKTKNVRGVDRDIFFVEQGAYDLLFLATFGLGSTSSYHFVSLIVFIRRI